MISPPPKLSAKSRSRDDRGLMPLRSQITDITKARRAGSLDLSSSQTRLDFWFASIDRAVNGDPMLPMYKESIKPTDVRATEPLDPDGSFERDDNYLAAGNDSVSPAKETPSIISDNDTAQYSIHDLGESNSVKHDSHALSTKPINTYHEPIPSPSLPDTESYSVHGLDASSCISKIKSPAPLDSVDADPDWPADLFLNSPHSPHEVKTNHDLPDTLDLSDLFSEPSDAPKTEPDAACPEPSSLAERSLADATAGKKGTHILVCRSYEGSFHEDTTPFADDDTASTCTVVRASQEDRSDSRINRDRSLLQWLESQESMLALSSLDTLSTLDSTEGAATPASLPISTLKKPSKTVTLDHFTRVTKRVSNKLWESKSSLPQKRANTVDKPHTELCHSKQ